MVVLSRSKTFNSNNKVVKERIWIAVKLTLRNRAAKVDVESRTREVGLFQRVQDCTCECPRSLNMSRTSMCDKVLCWCDTQDKEKSQETLGGLILADCVGREIRTRPDD